MQHLSLKERAYRIIKSKLLNGQFKPGERIREDLIAEEISMSRTPVREAINQLSAEGLVKNISRKGIYPIELSIEQILDIIDVRKALETLAIVRCIEKIQPEQLEQIKSIHNEFECMLSKGDYSRCNELDSKFHLGIAAVTKNEKLIKFLSEIEDFMRIARVIEKKNQPKQKNIITFKEHSKILECIENKDTEGAIAAVKENIERMKKNIGL